MNRTEMTVEKARARLSNIWIWGCMPLLLIVIIQSTMGYYAEGWQLPWGWILPLIFPTLSLITGVWSAGSSKVLNATVKSQHVVRLTQLLSVAYIASLYIILILSTISPLGSKSVMESSTWFLIPFQGIVTVGLGKFFVEDVDYDAGPEANQPQSGHIDASTRSAVS